MEELRLALAAITASTDKVAKDFGSLPAKDNGSSEYHYLRGKLEAYTDVQNLIMWRINELSKGEKK